MVDLNTLVSTNCGWELVSAQAINDSGQIAGYGTINGQTDAFLLTPVPEPATWALLAFGSLVFLFRRRREPQTRAIVRGTNHSGR